MNWPYAYTLYLWPMLASAVFMAALGLYSWRHRSVPGALPFAIMLLFVMLWLVGATLELAAANLDTKIFWFKFVAVMKLPAASAELCFGLAYAGFGRLLTRRNVALLSIPPLLMLVLTPTNDAHHLLWLGFRSDGDFYPLRSSLAFVFAGYSFVLAAAICAVMIRLLARSPQHRWPVILIMSEVVIARAAVLLDFIGGNPFAPMDPVVLVWNPGAVIYALALFRFRMFDLIPAARETVIEQMREGMLVLDAQRRIVDLNPAGERILGVAARSARGHMAAQVLPAYPELYSRPEQPRVEQSELKMSTGETPQYFALQRSPLKDRAGVGVGELILLHDVSEQKRVQGQFLEQQQALAVARERQRMASELHDSVTQSLFSLMLLADAARRSLASGNLATLEGHHRRLSEIAHQVLKETRLMVYQLRPSALEGNQLIDAIQRRLDAVEKRAGVEATLQCNSLPELPEAIGIAFYRVAEEALNNALRHAAATCVTVTLSGEGRVVTLQVRDNGKGFDPNAMSDHGGMGLVSMRQRMELISGNLAIASTIGQGTGILACVQIPGNGAG